MRFDGYYESEYNWGNRQYWRFYPQGLVVSYAYRNDKLPTPEQVASSIRFTRPSRQLYRGRWWREGDQLGGLVQLVEYAVPEPPPGRREIPRAGRSRFWGTDGEEILQLQREDDFDREWHPKAEKEECHFRPYPLPEENPVDLLAAAERYLLPAAERVNPADRAELVQADGLWFYRFPVTVGQYRRVIGRRPDAPAYGWNNLLPMVLVTFEQASAYALAVGARLPSEAEWTRLAAGPQGRVFPWGDEADASLLTIAAKVPSWPDRHPDGASFEGALDLAGNVSEWTTDKFKGKRVIKGGNYRSKSMDECRCQARQLVNQDTLKPWLGFRCVMLD